MNKFVSIILFFSSPFLLAATDSKITVGELELEYCHIDGYRQEVLCGEYSVYEDRVSQQGRQIAIQFAVMPAVSIEQNP
ncbi:MAG: hypothetical protein QGG54_06090, partial [Gammaproteobacteria bacterium]|nr:hypothetical protein [Gammaproteobacteria bacterium]